MIVLRVQLISILGLAAFSGCATQSTTPEVITQTYYPASRQLPPEPIYSRLMWSHLPQPAPEPTAEKAPYLLPVISFDFPDSNLEEAIQALAQTIGYRWDYPRELGSRSVSIKTVGTVDEILKEVGRQAGVTTALDHKHRLVRVVQPQTMPKLPGTKRRY